MRVLLIAEMSNVGTTINWYNIVKDFVYPPISTSLVLWITYLIYIRVSKYENRLTKTTNEEMKDRKRQEELEQMVTLQQISDIVFASEQRILKQVNQRLDDLENEMNRGFGRINGEMGQINSHLQTIELCQTAVKNNIAVIVNNPNYETN